MNKRRQRTENDEKELKKELIAIVTINNDSVKYIMLVGRESPC
jgi:hypothetical protein